VQETAIGLRLDRQVGHELHRLADHFAVGGEIVLAAQQIVVGARQGRPLGIDIKILRRGGRRLHNLILSGNRPTRTRLPQRSVTHHYQCGCVIKKHRPVDSNRTALMLH
jgi:hypothetical protein